MNGVNAEKREKIEGVLGAVTDPRTGRPWRERAAFAGGKEGLHVSVRSSGRVHVVLELPQPPGEVEKRLASAMEQALQGIEWVSSGQVVLTTQAPPTGERRSPPERLKMENIRRIIVVASAKGGVGKSTLAVNLALATAARGLRVGLLDADIHGPSVPVMLGTQDEKPQQHRHDGKARLLPLQAHGILSLSLGNLAEAGVAVAWRGPMAGSALLQLLGETDWGELDVMFMDTPPGTGDVLLTLAQRVRIDGAVIVTTPQEVALSDVRRGVSMFEKAEIPILGLVENMAWFEDGSGERVRIFGGGGGELAKFLGTELLGSVPLHPSIARSGDSGCPAVLEGGELARGYTEMAEKLLELVFGEGRGTGAGEGLSL